MRLISLLVTTLLLLTACTKKDATHGPLLPSPLGEAPLRVVRSIYSYQENGTMVYDTTDFTYDERGRVKTRKFPRGPIQTYTYSGDTLVSLIEGSREVLRKPVDMSRDTFSVDFLPSEASFEDSIVLTYVLRNEKLIDFWTFINAKESCNCGLHNHLQKEGFVYNADGNITRKTIQTPPNTTTADQFTASEWDDKINPRISSQRANAFAMYLPLPLESFSTHNPTKFSDGFTTYEIEMTYNDAGYPLTYKYKDKDFISTRLFYDR